MPDFPLPLDSLIAYVKALRPDGGPLDRLFDAVTVATRLDESSDALIGYFVDQARSSGASWSQIGASMGVSKQAAQKRFVPRAEDLPHEGKAFSRFTPRARMAVAAAGQLAAESGADAVEVAHVVAGLLTEPHGIAAKVIHRLGAADEQVRQALDVGRPTGGYDSDPTALRGLSFDPSSRAAFREALKAALHLGHNYIGTEHLLVGAVSSENDTARKLAAIGLSRKLVDSALAVELAQFQLERIQQAG